jgi:hypothetical protein
MIRGMCMESFEKYFLEFWGSEFSAEDDGKN